MSFRVSILSGLVLLALLSCGRKQKRILLYLVEKHGESLSLMADRFLQVCQKNNILADTTSSLAYVTEDSLAHYNCIVFAGFSPDNLDYRQQNDLERFIQGGAGLFVLDANKDSVLNWPWFHSLTQERIDDGENPWKARYDGGHVYFAQTTDASRLDEILADGLDYTLSEKPDYNDATTPRVPEDNRFIAEILDTFMYEPMEMVIFKDGRVLYLERRGLVKLYSPVDHKTRTIAAFDVSTTGNYEDGMLGVTLDPDYEKNHWIYINYSPAGDIPKQNVSRFEMIGDSIIRSSEKIVLEIPTQRETCCHSGGHLEFGPNGDLYISVGDNTNSDESDGFSPIDERPGRAPFDAQKSSANTNDLRGKILRIHPEPDGTYTIPDGNLFPKDGSHGKPEIYVMGTRNPFRFTIDDHNGILYWGDVGPDGGITNERGPQSHDEFNQARKPGNYGWPYFVADNKAYADFDFATNAIGPKFNPDEPINASPNNTGAKVLPPAQKPMIWYPYGVSKEFPILGTGSRSAMSGPVYYYDDFKNAKNRFPKYFDGKLFIYEWARSWIKAVSFDDDSNLARIEPFLQHETWYKPIDIKFGPDGSLYVLQYGANYFEHNADSRLVKITYVAGDRAPQAHLAADKVVGAVPLKVTLSAEKSFDFDSYDSLSYLWNVGLAQSEKMNGKRITVTYDKPGIYKPTVTVIDKEGKRAAAQVEIRAGNEPPHVAIEITRGNNCFYSNQSKIDYSVKVTDKEDGSPGKGIDPSDVFFSFDYLRDEKDLALLASNENMAGDISTLRGKMAISGSDCKTCHTLKERSIGPSYLEVAHRYAGRDVVNVLARKVIAGGNGNWGNSPMAAHPQHSEQEAAEMVRYILSLSRPPRKPLPLKGSIATRDHVKTKTNGYYVLRSTYTDRGNPETGTLTASDLLILRYPKVEAEDADILSKTKNRTIDGADPALVGVDDGSYLLFKDIDLTGIKKIHLKAGAQLAGSFVEVRAGNVAGPLLGKADIPEVEDFKAPVKPGSAILANAGKRQDLYFVFHNSQGNKKDIAIIDWIFFDDGSMEVPE